MSLRIAIAAGGTAGHIMPALALAEELRSRGNEVSFIGVGGRAGSGIPAEHGYAEDHVPLRGFDRRLSLRNIGAVVQAALAAEFSVTPIRRQPHPYAFACPAGVLRHDGWNTGCTGVSSPWGDAVAERLAG